jgi:hypothetical protein
MPICACSHGLHHVCLFGSRLGRLAGVAYCIQVAAQAPTTADQQQAAFNQTLQMLQGSGAVPDNNSGRLSHGVIFGCAVQ